MPPQARLGDKALIPADAHGCVACPHTASGPAVAGSPNVNVNGRPAIRVDDPGIHTACCGGNTWNAQTGSKSVFINGKPAHRLGDVVRHCGGVGKCIEGSGNVIVGDLTSRGESSSDGQYATIIVNMKLNELPLDGVPISANHHNQKHTDQLGGVLFDKIPKGAASIQLGGRNIWNGILSPGEQKVINLTVPLMFIGCGMKKFKIR